MDPVLTYADDRKLREDVWRTYYNRGDNGDEHDNNQIITEILSLRAARAKLLGYDTHAHWRLQGTMAKTPEATMDLMMKVWPKAVARVREEVADMQAIADAEGANITIEPWDYRYLRRKSSQGQIRPRSQRSETVPATRKASRRNDVGRRRIVRLSVQAD